MASRLRPWIFQRKSIIQLHPPTPKRVVAPRCGRGYAQVMSSPAIPSFRLPAMNLHIIAPIVLLGTGSVVMVYWYFSSNEFLDAGFPPRAAEAFRIASVAADDWQLRHAIRYYRKGIEIAIAHGISPFDDRILWVKGKMMSAIKREEDIGLEREVLEEIKEQAVQELRAGNVQDRGKLVALAVQASLSLAATYNDAEDINTRHREFLWGMRALQQENQRQRSLPNPPAEHWGWIPQKHDRAKILKSIATFAQEIHRPSLALTYYFESLPLYPPDYPDSLESMLQIGRLVRYPGTSKLSKEQLVHQSDIWFNKILTIRPTIPRNLPPSEKYVKSKGSKDNTYTLWGWDRKCDQAYVSAIWEKGLNYKILGNTQEAEKKFDEAIDLCEKLKMKEFLQQLKKARLELQGKSEQARNPYFWG